jgi:predicted PurR-regulated permease PerM
MEKAILNYLSKNQFITGILFVAILFILFALKEILLVVFVAYIIVAALLPAVEFLRKRKIPNTVSVILVFFTALILFGVLVAPLVPFLSSQIQQLFKSFPQYLNRAASILGVELSIKEVTQLISPQQLGQNAFALAGGVVGGFVATITAIAISFYLLLDYDKIKNNIANLFPKKNYLKITAIIEEVNKKLGAWLQGQMLLSLSIGLITWVVLTVIGMPFALPLAVLAGMFEIIPSIGPVISAVPAIIVALTISPNLAIVVIVSYILIQFIENHLLVPRIMQRAVGLNPVVVIIGVIVGSTLLGIPGALLSVPFISLLTLIIKDVQQYFEE